MTYAERPVSWHGVAQLGGWLTKVYGMAVTGTPSTELVGAATAKAAAALPEPDGRAAFVLAHQARPACFVLVCWWASDVDLCQRYFRAPLDDPAALTPMPAEAVGCVWELAVTTHERTAWIRHLLTGDPDLAGYLDDALAGGP